MALHYRSLESIGTKEPMGHCVSHQMTLSLTSGHTYCWPRCLTHQRDYYSSACYLGKHLPLTTEEFSTEEKHSKEDHDIYRLVTSPVDFYFIIKTEFRACTLILMTLKVNSWCWMPYMEMDKLNEYSMTLFYEFYILYTNVYCNVMVIIIVVNRN